MRRSCAPSVKELSNRNQEKFKTPISVKPQNQGSSVSSSQDNFLEKSSNEKNSSKQLYFSVLWSKRTTKKNKTWEGDGILVVKSKMAILKDLHGTFLSSTNQFKIDELVEGYQMVLGSKEIEIQEKLTKEPIYSRIKPKEESSEGKETTKDGKQKKRSSSNLFNLHLNTRPMKRGKFCKVSTKSTAEQENIEPLVIPSPNCDHWWKYNKENLEITEMRVPNALVKHLRPHQREGVIFLIECLLGYKNLDHIGAIIADEMGLGKTLQCLAACFILLRDGPYGGRRIIHRVLIVTPSSLVENWNKEVHKWLGQFHFYAYIVDGKNKVKGYSKQMNMPFVIVSYETFINYYNDFKELNFDLLICDEGHRLKNNNTKAFIHLQQLSIPRRVILTGTPIQNDLQEFYTLVDFVNPGILGSYQEYKYNYETPIIRSQQPKAAEEIKEVGQLKSAELLNITNKFILRRTQLINTKYLPGKREFIVFVRPSELQQYLCKKVLEWYESTDDSIEKDCIPLQIITLLKKICNHPSLIRTAKSDTSLITYIMQFLPDWNDLGPFDSGKVEVIESLLEETIKNKEKIILVSNHTKTLDMLGSICDHYQYKYVRLDGKTPPSERISIVEKFNHQNSDNSVFLLSTKAGGVGLNLYGASRLALFDNDWNPAVDQQAISRIWRDGQKMNVKIYRLITAGTIEEKIFQRQIAKTSLGNCVFKDNNGKDSIKFSDEALKDLFSIQDETNEDCITHSYLNCNCEGNGEIPPNPITLGKKEDPFKVDLNNEDDQVNAKILEMNELIKWEHYRQPINDKILKEAGLATCSENITFIFSHKSELNC